MPRVDPPVRWTVWFWPALIATLVFDLVSKYAVFALPAASLPSWVQRHYNTGVAWSLLADRPLLVAGLTSVLVPLLVVVWWTTYRRIGWPENLSFGMILGGALGNGYDRAMALLGHCQGVRDFIHADLNIIGIPYVWPTFNIADCGISIGFILLFLRAFSPATTASTAHSAS